MAVLRGRLCSTLLDHVLRIIAKDAHPLESVLLRIIQLEGQDRAAGGIDAEVLRKKLPDLFGYSIKKAKMKNLRSSAEVASHLRLVSQNSHPLNRLTTTLRGSP